ncbi:hypothetical protein [Nocardiopsis sp. NRRL B-16309]|uniref:hypothetical protein n=1 Tax=Nocardiopsis sp. NRRL B-16309 TaxID=1519494 RepID=UPI0006AFBB2B|nr:hypothetical protein [Nocardiopsis sp. NRRL B-16309]KOX10483.1 hypothetical protein ADL05_24585 [Nocardiopsis sp. NRRL B-16309]
MGENSTDFDQTSTEELRERAIDLARKRWDVRFFWQLLRMIPAAEAAAGNEEGSRASIAQASGFLYEALSAESDPKVHEALRPVYIEYLREHAAEESGDPGGGGGPGAPDRSEG